MLVYQRVPYHSTYLIMSSAETPLPHSSRGVRTPEGRGEASVGNGA